MPLLVLLFALSVVLAPAIGWLVERRGAGRTTPSRWSPVSWGAAAQARLGPVLGPVGCVIVGIVVCVAVILPLGFVAKHLQTSVDSPVFVWIADHKQLGTFDKINNTFTIVGNRDVTELVVLVAVLVLVPAYGRRWWLPLVVIGVAFFLQRQGQTELTSIVHRRIPSLPGSGSYPSGGVSRLLGVDGTIALVAAGLVPRLSRAWRIGLVTGVYAFALVEAYTRVYLQVHWLSDATGGLLFGTVVLVTAAAVNAALVVPGGLGAPREPGAPDGTQPGSRRTRRGGEGDTRSTTRPVTSPTP